MALTKRTYVDQQTVITAKNLNDIQDEIIANGQNIGKNAGMVAAAYDSTDTYSEGDYCTYQNVMYKCNTDIDTPEDWTAAHWTECTVADEMGSGGGGDASSELICEQYDSTASYEVGSHCIYNGLLYRCNTAIASGGETWTSAHWDEVSVSEEIELINNNFAGHYSSTSAYATGKYVLHEGELYRCIVRVATGGETWNSAHWTKVDVGSELKSFINYLATEYSATSTYAEGKFCIYQGKLYKCISRISSAEAWNSSHWASTNLGDAIYNLQLTLAQPYSPALTYDVGDVVMHGGSLYRCKTAITTAEAWDFSHWAQIINVMDVVGDGQLSGFTATNLTGAANELKTSLSSLDSDDIANASDVSGSKVSDAIETVDGRVDLTQSDIAIILQDPAQATFTKGTYVVYNNQLYTVKDGGIPAATPASTYYPGSLDAVSDGGLNSLNNNIGVLSSLNTTEKSNAVSAINEVFNKFKNSGGETLVMFYVSNLGFNDTFNALPVNSIAIIRIAASLNAPFTGNNYIGLQWKNGSGKYGDQYVTGFGCGGKIYFREMNNGTWGSWVQM